MKNGKKTRRLMPDELEALLHAARFRVRDSAILAVLLSTGMRVGELVGLRIEDVDFDDKEVHIEWEKSKQGDERRVCIDDWGLQAVRKYLDGARGDCGPYEVLFVSRLGGRLGIQSVQRLIRKYGKAAGIERAVTPHRLRHTFASECADKGAPPWVIQHQLGHASLGTTMSYIQASAATIRKEYDAVRERVSPQTAF